MTDHCAAMADQRSWRDLRHLEQLVGTVHWVDIDEAVVTPHPLVVCGLWVSREPTAGRLMRRRAEAGLASLLVAQFEPVDLAPILGAPVSVHIAAGETPALAWDDGRRYQVPGVTVIQTALAQGHWARSTAGTVVLAFRPRTQAGLIVLCTATMARPALGTDRAEQQALAHRLLAEIALRAPVRNPSAGVKAPPQVSTTAAEYLECHGSDGALVLLAAVRTPGGPVDRASLAALGAALSEQRIVGLVAALPPSTPDEIERALRAAGWGAHLRALGNRRVEA